MAPSETFRLAFPTADPIRRPYTLVSYGLPFPIACANHVSETFHSKKAYLIASKSLSTQTSRVRDLEKALGPNLAGTWIGIRPHTPWEDLVPIINDMREKEADCLITLGGGSLTDGAKLIIHALANNVRTLSDLEDLTRKTKADADGVNREFRDRSTGQEPTVPIICIPTTLSGGEYTRFGGGTSTLTHLKVLMTHPKMYPSLVILDPELCTTTPEWVWLSTGVRAIDHCVEAMTSTMALPDVDTEAEKALKLLLPNLLITKHNPTDLTARLNCQLGTNIIMYQLLYAPEILLSGGSHGIGHQLGPLGVGHGQTSCILLPAVLQYNSRVNSAAQQKVKKIIWSDSAVTGVLRKAGLEQKSSDAGQALRAIFTELGMPSSLKEFDIGQDKFDLLAENSIHDPCCLTNSIPLTEKSQVLEILEMVKG